MLWCPAQLCISHFALCCYCLGVLVIDICNEFTEGRVLSLYIYEYPMLASAVRDLEGRWHKYTQNESDYREEASKSSPTWGLLRTKGDFSLVSGWLLPRGASEESVPRGKGKYLLLCKKTQTFGLKITVYLIMVLCISHWGWNQMGGSSAGLMWDHSCSYSHLTAWLGLDS